MNCRYQKTAEGVKAGAEKTGAMFGGLSAKIAAIKESDTFRNLEEKVGSAYTNVKVIFAITNHRFAKNFIAPSI